MRYALAFCIILSVFGCNKKTSNAATETTFVTPEKKPEISSRTPPMNASDIVKAIADFGRVESSHTGIAAMPSKQHNRFIDLRDNIQEADLKKLLEHDNRVVKYYAFRALRENGDKNLKTYYKQMADDQGMVKIMNGCVMSEVALPLLLKQEMAKGATRSEKAESKAPRSSNK